MNATDMFEWLESSSLAEYIRHSQATSLGYNRVFWTKLILITLAFLNAGYFHRYTFDSIERWNHMQPTPPGVKAAGIISIVLWTGVITCGRFLAYLE